MDPPPNRPLLKTKRELLSSLSLNLFRIWIPNFSLIAKLLYEATKGCLDEPLFIPSLLANPLCQLTQSLLLVPTLHLPDHTRPFFLFAHSNQGQALGLLCQQARDTWAPIANLSKQLDMLTKGWPPCIQARATGYPKQINSLFMPFNSLFSTHLVRLAITLGFPLPSPFQGTGSTCLSP